MVWTTEAEAAVKKPVALLLAAVLLAGSAFGCGSRPQKDVNKDKDRPKSAEKDQEAAPSRPRLIAPSHSVRSLIRALSTLINWQESVLDRQRQDRHGGGVVGTV